MALTSSDPRECFFTAGLDLKDRLDKHMVLLAAAPSRRAKLFLRRLSAIVPWRPPIALFVKMGIPFEY
ncbi:hypothetical protein ACVWZL_008923 [Bradyrhizobium sp. GM2.4]